MSKHKGNIEYCRHVDASIIYHQMRRIHLSKNKYDIFAYINMISYLLTFFVISQMWANV